MGWLKKTPPTDIDYPTSINHNEIGEADVENIIDVENIMDEVKSEDLEERYPQYPNISQGSKPSELSDIRIRILPIFS